MRGANQPNRFIYPRSCLFCFIYILNYGIKITLPFKGRGPPSRETGTESDEFCRNCDSDVYNHTELVLYTIDDFAELGAVAPCNRAEGFFEQGVPK